MSKQVDRSRFLDEEFGQGGEFGVFDHLLSPRGQLYLAAWYHACPNPNAVAEVYGVELAVCRYLECNHAWNQIKEMARGEPSLYLSLITPVPRASDEPVGVHDPDRVPANHHKVMSPLSTAYGYANPRVVRELGGRGQYASRKREKFARRAIRPVVEASRTPIELLARLTQLAAFNAEYPVDMGVLLGHVLEPEVLKEENCRMMLREVAEELRRLAVPVWQYYLNLTSGEKTRLGILQSIP